MITPKEDCEARALLESLGIKYPSDGHLNILDKYDAALRGQLEGKQLVIAQLENDAAKKDALIVKLVEALEMVSRNDKTVYDYGKSKTARNADGKLSDAGRWATPREIADAVLYEARKVMK